MRAIYFSFLHNHHNYQLPMNIYDLSGRVVYQLPMTNNQSPITIGENLKPGIYFVKSEGLKPVKVVKVK